jgi:hypothetical protein
MALACEPYHDLGRFHDRVMPRASNDDTDRPLDAQQFLDRRRFRADDIGEL